MPKIRVIAFTFIVFFGIIMAVAAGAEDLFGVAVYPGATQDSATTNFLKNQLKVNGAAYRTNDSLAKVADFYKSQKDLKAIDVQAEGALFKKGKVDVTLQNPWMDMKTGKMVNDTLISIVGGK